MTTHPGSSPRWPQPCHTQTIFSAVKVHQLFLVDAPFTLSLWGGYSFLCVFTTDQAAPLWHVCWSSQSQACQQVMNGRTWQHCSTWPHLFGHKSETLLQASRQGNCRCYVKINSWTGVPLSVWKIEMYKLMHSFSVLLELSSICVCTLNLQLLVFAPAQ